MTNSSFDYVKKRFGKFLESIGNVLKSEKEILTIQNKLRRHFNTISSDYLHSDEFQLLFDSIEKIFHEQKTTSKYYSSLASFDDQLKKHSNKFLKLKQSQENMSSLRTVSLIDVQETLDALVDQCCQILDQTLVPICSSKNENQVKILKLERRLARLSKIIRELEEKDMSLDEMANCDLYEVEASLKEKACFLYEKLTKLKNQSNNTERIINKKIKLNESDYPLITKELETMVNRSVDLPAFADILNVVEEANKNYNLHLSEEIQRKFAEKSFKFIGKEFKTRRMADFQDIMLSRLPEDFNIEQNDPALENEAIEQVLVANEREAVIKTEQILEEYSQIEPDPENEINTESVGEESADELEQPIIQQIEHDAIDYLPPFSVRPLTPVESMSDINEISLNDRPMTILSTASLPSQDEPTEKILQPRRRTTFQNNETIYNLYQERLTNNYQSSSTSASKSIRTKRLLSSPSNSLAKKVKQPDLIILD